MAPRTLIDAALAGYPSWWRERYEPEVRATVEQLLADGRAHAPIALGLARRALRARFFARGLPLTYAHYAKRARLSIAAATIPWLVMTPFLLALTGQFTLHSKAGPVTEGYPFEPIGPRIGVYNFTAHYTIHPPMSSATWILGWMTSAIDVVFIVTLLILALGLRTFRSSLQPVASPRERISRWCSWVPLITVITLIGLSFLRDALGPRYIRYTHAGVAIGVGAHPALAEAAGDLRWVVAIMGWAISVIGLTVAASRADLPPASLRYGRTISVLTAISMSLSFVAFVAWCLAYRVQSGQQTIGAAVTVAYVHHAWWFAVALLLAVTVGIAQWGAYSAQRSWRTIATRDLWRTYSPNE